LDAGDRGKAEKMSDESEADNPRDRLRGGASDPRTATLLGDLERRLTMDWVGEHLSEVRGSAYGQRSLYWTLGIGFVVGLAAYAGGYALKMSVATEPLGFVGDLLYTLGWALWTGVVVVLFLQVIPEVKRRGYKQLLDAYEAERGTAAEGDVGGEPPRTSQP
jgi:hypothetical protein